MNIIEIAEEKAFEYHSNGFHCGEAVSRAILELFPDKTFPDIPMAATAFGSGMGMSKQEACGALSGGMLALGCLLGREKPYVPWDRLAGLAREFRQKYIDEFGATKCSDVLEALGEQENMAKCKRLSGKTAAMLALVLIGAGELPDDRPDA